MTTRGGGEETSDEERWLVVDGPPWRRSDPALPASRREALVKALMTARRGVRAALRTDDAAALVSARAAVDAAKRALGERGDVWWHDGAPDLTRRLAHTTGYAEWFAAAETQP